MAKYSRADLVHFVISTRPDDEVLETAAAHSQRVRDRYPSRWQSLETYGDHSRIIRDFGYNHTHNRHSKQSKQGIPLAQHINTTSNTVLVNLCSKTIHLAY